ncbi:MAG TPA: ABC transporter ATP-binding protein [Vicinamibacterales bacterium]|nr:ABC transporter ATP-binding protein [Vicinamibacterales bacterium]
MRLKCRDLTVDFDGRGRCVRALDGVTFETLDREFVSVVGPSGCGKTTLLRAIAGLLPVSQGVIERTPAKGDRSTRVLTVFQENSLFPWMTALENAAFGLEMQGVPRPERERRARAFLARFGFAGREHAYPHQLSLGMKQRIAVIRCFLAEPALMLMDEPFAALDALTRLTLQDELLALWEREPVSVIFVTHDLDEAIRLSDRVFVMSGAPGRMLAAYEVPLPRPRPLSLADDFRGRLLKARLQQDLGLDHADLAVG